MKRAAALLVLLLTGSAGATEAVAERHRVGALEVTVLSTMLTDMRGIGEWGFAALVEADGYRLLYDTGHRPETVALNARALGIDLSDVRDVVLSHNHGDHSGGLIPLRRALRETSPAALSHLHVGQGLFASRQIPHERLARMGFHFPDMNAVRRDYEALGGEVAVHAKPVELAPGVWLTGPVPRRHPERNWTPGFQVRDGETWVDDVVAEDSALVIDTEAGLVVISGCGHAGVVNILDYAREIVPGQRVRALIGGLHLFAASDETLEWTGAELARHGVETLVGAHCTGLHATEQLRERLGLGRGTAAVGAVGARFSLEGGLDPLPLAR